MNLPKVALTVEQKIENAKAELYFFIKRQMDEQEIRQEDVARVLHITQSGYSVALHRMSFDTDQLIRILHLLKADPETVGKLLTF